jgi:hypothetical protein
MFDSISKGYNNTFEPKIFDYLGMQLAADMATHMTALRENNMMFLKSVHLESSHMQSGTS